MSKKNFWVTGALLCCVGVQPQACRDEQTHHILSGNPLVRQYLDAVAEHVVLQKLEHFEAELNVLQEVLFQLQEEPEALEVWSLAQQQWVRTTQQWQTLEVLQIANLGSSLSVVGGADIRDRIYSWPTTSPCRMDQLTVTRSFQQAEFFEPGDVSVLGLDAVEYLLFADFETECPNQVSPVSDGVWAGFTESELRTRRSEFAAILVDELRTVTDEAIDFWQGGFPYDLYDEDVDGLNAVFDGMLYVESMLKERKLAYPMGYTTACTVDCWQEAEAIFSGQSLTWISANLDGLSQLLNPTEEIAFSMILSSIAEEDLAIQLEETLAIAEGQVQSMDEAFPIAIQENAPSLMEFYSTVSQLTELLKWNVSAVLQLEVPQSAAGDND